MAQISVDPDALSGVAQVVSRAVGELEQAAALVAACADAAAATPAAAACDTAVRSACRVSQSLHGAVQTLSGQLNAAAKNYEDANNSSTMVCVAGSEDGHG